jgi:hypothetical protein
MSIPTVLETLQTYRAAKNAVNRFIPQDFQMFSTTGNCLRICHSEPGEARRGTCFAVDAPLKHATVWPSASKAQRFARTAKRKTEN